MITFHLSAVACFLDQSLDRRQKVCSVFHMLFLSLYYPHCSDGHPHGLVLKTGQWLALCPAGSSSEAAGGPACASCSSSPARASSRWTPVAFSSSWQPPSSCLRCRTGPQPSVADKMAGDMLYYSFPKMRENVPFVFLYLSYFT